MRRLLISTALATLMSTSAFAAKIGVSIVNFDNNFQTLLMHGMQDRAKVTVFQNARGQGGVDAALALAESEKVDHIVYVPFELVTPANAADYLSKN
ncbi:hypothetical protein GCM10007881_24210 [Mesorhizobium huakuii]|uniref:hypothetical protein n=1 Tax=Mesorhizobium huakuii TaxID=28104 RepID=UPI00235C95BD|nr:hypothetical protein GCM10007881_24210 [Mesorhizobium huakuii]